MEHSKNKEEVVRLSERTEDSLREKVPFRGRSDGMAILYRPNNFRRQAVFSFKNSTLFGLRMAGQKLYFEDRGRVKLQVGKRKITAIWLQWDHGKKEVFKLQGSLRDVAAWIDEKKDLVASELDSAIMAFCERRGVRVGDIVWERAEEWIKGDGYIDSLPRDMILHDTVCKKVYGDGVEALTGKGGQPGVYVKNYFKNRMLEDAMPELVSELRGLRDLVSVRIDPVEAILQRLRPFKLDWYKFIVSEPIRSAVLALSDVDKCRLTEELFKLTTVLAS